METNFFKGFTNQYSLSKTLRFELIPIGKTLVNIETKGLLAQDNQRASSYKQMKKTIDEYHKDLEEIEKNILEWLPENMREKKLVPIIFERISKWGDIKETVARGELDLFFKQPEYKKEKLIYKDISLEKISNNLKQAINALQGLEEKDFDQENIKSILMTVADKLENRGELLHPVRFALSGLDKSPDPFIIAEILGKNETLSRLQKAV